MIMMVMITGHLEVVKSAKLLASYLAMMGVLGLSTLSARANGKLGMTTVIEAEKILIILPMTVVRTETAKDDEHHV